MPQLKPFELAENMLVFAGQESHPNLASALKSCLNIKPCGWGFLHTENFPWYRTQERICLLGGS